MEIIDMESFGLKAFMAVALELPAGGPLLFRACAQLRGSL